MLAEYFQSPIRIEEIRGCPAGRMLEEFARELHQAGYAQLTARRHLRAAEHLVHWTGGRDIPVLALEERFIKEFSQHLNLCQCPGYGRSHRLELENGVREYQVFEDGSRYDCENGDTWTAQEWDEYQIEVGADTQDEDEDA
jgi:hypothetical protein